MLQQHQQQQQNRAGQLQAEQAFANPPTVSIPPQTGHPPQQTSASSQQRAQVCGNNHLINTNLIKKILYLIF